MSTKNVAVSVILPTYNRSELLRSAMRSVLAQTVTDWELIVVDDNSSDDTLEVVKSMKDARISYTRHEVNKGGSSARNTGIRRATGELVAFLDDDDIWARAYLEKQMKAIVGYDAVTCDYCLHGQTPRASRIAVMPITVPILRKGYAGCGTSGLVVRRAVLDSLLFDETLPSGQDWDLLLRLAQSYRIGFLTEPLVIYEQGSHTRISNQIANSSLHTIEKHMRVLLKHKDLLGQFWFNYHAARLLLYGIKSRSNRFRHLFYAIKRCGVIAVTAFYLGRVFRVWQVTK